MPRLQKKKFFREPSLSEIKKLDLISADSNLIRIMLGLNHKQALVVEKNLIPAELTPRKFKKHGQIIEIPIGKIDETPFQLRRRILDNLEDIPYAYLSFIPLQGKDLRERVVPPIECLEAARIIYYSFYTYPQQLKDLCFLEAEPYDKVKRAGLDGIIATSKVPSRTVGVKPHEFNLIHVPIKDNENKIIIASTIGSTGHDCKAKQFFFGYAQLEDKEEFNVHYCCAHIIAAYWRLAKYYKREGEDNIIPLEMSPFLYPTQFGIDIYKLILSRTLIRDETLTTKDKLRKPRMFEKNSLIFEAVKEFKHDPIFYNKGIRAHEQLQYCNWD